MKIEINWLIFPLALYFIISKNIDTYIIFMIFIILHELVHMLVGKINGWKIKKLTINPLGLNMEMYYYGKKKSKLVYFLSGPLFNFIVFLIIKLYFKEIDELYVKIAQINLLLCIFNMLPILPLDGGKILREIFIKKYNISSANKLSINISKIILILISLIYSVVILKLQNIVILIAFIYLWYLFYMEDKKFELYKKIEKSVKMSNI